MTEERPRDRAVRVRSKEALVEVRRESAEQFPLADRPFRAAAQEIVTEIAKMFSEVIRAVSESLNYVEGLGKRQEISQAKHELLP